MVAERISATYDAKVLAVEPIGKPLIDYIVKVSANLPGNEVREGYLPLSRFPDRRAYNGMPFSIDVAIEHPGELPTPPENIRGTIRHKDVIPDRIFDGVVYEVQGGRVHAALLNNLVSGEHLPRWTSFDETNVSGSYTLGPYREEFEAMTAIHILEMRRDGKVLIRPAYYPGVGIIEQLGSALAMDRFKGR